MYVIRELAEEQKLKGEPFFNRSNPIATKGDFIICFDNIAMNNKLLYCLYYKTTFLGYFDTLQSAKAEADKPKI